MERIYLDYNATTPVHPEVAIVMRQYLEEDFGNSVRSMISAQTLNPNPEPAGEESGDGQRLEGVLDDYRKTTTTRTSVSSETGLGVQ